ncbi:hypothetical protein SBRY_30318 [Actinacidiphila bryophytorum]|uniref:Uncharacterized protein n=1 Tax=Actinacidiphila bryophytorum TaxID=1436133 RepID=A0A9W4MB74_9ACTN|nr:hypothetical protein SBRY_30318 [Actinacidiphila bryophytorum]
MRRAEHAAGQGGRRPGHARLAAAAGVPAAGLRHPARHLRRHASQRVGRAQAGRGLRRRDVPGLGPRGALRRVLTSPDAPCPARV